MFDSTGLALDLQSLSYRYPQSDKVALSEVSYTFPTGTTAIVGPNGAGKSTLVKLLTGLLAPTSGSIRVRLPDGTCLAPDQAHRAVLFQEPSHLYLTIRQNVTMRYERTPTEDARIHEALDIAGLHRVVQGLPDGIDTLVGAGFGGRLDLSGGQWQRLALARLIYQDAPVMILDEPVASLDPEGERAVFELFAQVTQAKVVLFTTHRYDSIPRGTQIVVLVDGRIAEAGTHEELLERQRHYWSLYTAGAPTAGNAPAREALRAVPEQWITPAARSSLSPARKVHATPSADQETRSPRARRFVSRLIYPEEPGSTPALHNGNPSGLSPNGPPFSHRHLLGVRRQPASGSAEGNFTKPVADDAARSSDVQERTGPAPRDNRSIPQPQPMDLRWVQDAVWGDPWLLPDAEQDSAGRMALHGPRPEKAAIRRGGQDVR